MPESLAVFEECCKHAKEHNQPIVIADPRVLGDSYEAIIGRLDLLAKYHVPLHIACTMAETDNREEAFDA